MRNQKLISLPIFIEEEIEIDEDVRDDLSVCAPACRSQDCIGEPMEGNTLKSERLKKIIEENKKFEQESPYNFCDRWCERCTHEKQMRCRLYLDDLERRATCIAHGKDEDDPEITGKVLEAQYEGLEEKLKETADKLNIDLDNIDINEEDLDTLRCIDVLDYKDNEGRSLQPLID